MNGLFQQLMQRHGRNRGGGFSGYGGHNGYGGYGTGVKPMQSGGTGWSGSPAPVSTGAGSPAGPSAPSAPMAPPQNGGFMPPPKPAAPMASPSPQGGFAAPPQSASPTSGPMSPEGPQFGAPRPVPGAGGSMPFDGLPFDGPTITPSFNDASTPPSVGPQMGAPAPGSYNPSPSNYNPDALPPGFGRFGGMALPPQGLDPGMQKFDGGMMDGGLPPSIDKVNGGINPEQTTSILEKLKAMQAQGQGRMNIPETDLENPQRRYL